MNSLMRKLTEEELKKPYAKFYFQDLPEPDPTVIEIYKKGPMDWRDALDPENVNELLNPGYHKVETGYCQMPDGTAYIATLYKMPGVTLDMINWWYAWHALEDLRYMIWYPGSHLSIKVTEEGRKKICDPNISPEEKHMNITHIVCEDIMGTGQIPAPHAIPFVDMETLGFDPELYAKKDTTLQLETEPDTTVTISAVGDIMITDELLADAKQPDGSYNFAESFAAVSGYTLSSDLTIGNLECNFCGAPYAGKPDYRAPESLATTLSTIGFDLLQTANTCSIQNGLSGLQSTISYLTNAGIDHAGTYADAAERAANNGVVIKNVSGLKVAIIAYTKGLGGLQLPEGAEYAVNLLYKDYSTDYEKLDTQALLQSVDAAKELKPDVILVMLHWGSEATLEVTKTQQSLAKQLFERGANAILGTHSHLVGKMETMDVTTDDGKDKTCFVAYSLGNFFSSQDSSYASGCESSVILNLQFTKNGETGETALTGVNYTPLYLMDRGSGADGAQYEILPIRTAIASGLFPDDTQTLTDAISRLRTRTESDFDSGK